MSVLDPARISKRIPGYPGRPPHSNTDVFNQRYKPRGGTHSRNPIQRHSVLKHELSELLGLLLYYLDVVSDVITIFLIFPVSRPIACLLIAIMILRVFAQLLVNFTTDFVHCIRTIVDVDFAWSYMFAPWRSSWDDRPEIEFVECIFESGPTFIVQMALFLYIQYLPTGFDAVAFFLLSTGLSLLECINKFYGFSLRYRHAGLRLALFTAADLFASCMTHALFAYKISLLISDAIGAADADIALVIGVIVTMVGWWLICMVIIFVLRKSTNSITPGSVFVESFALLFSSIPLYTKARTRTQIFIQLVQLPYIIAVGSVYIASSPGSSFELYAGIAVISCGAARLLLSPFPQRRDDDAQSDVIAQLRGSTRWFVRGFRFLFTVAGLGAVAALGVFLNLVLSSNLTSLNCNSLAHSQLTGLLGVNVLSSLTVTPECQLCLLSAVNHITLFESTAATQKDVGLTGTSVQLDGKASCAWVASINAARFPALSFIQGDLVVNSNPALTSLAVNQLLFVGGALTFDSNPQLTSLNLSILTWVAGDVEITSSSALTFVDFSQLTHVGRTISLTSNHVLTAVLLPQLAYFGNSGGGYLSALIIEQNDALLSLSLPKVTYLSQYASIRGNMQLVDISLPLLTFIDSGLFVGNDTKIQELDFPLLSCVTTEVQINSNMLLSVVDFPVLTQAPYFGLSSNAALTSVLVPLLKNVLDMHIYSNVLLTTMDFPQVTICAYIDIYFNTALATVTMPKLTFVSSFLSLSRFSGLALLDFPVLTYVGGSIHISSAMHMTTLSLPQLQILLDSMTVVVCPLLTVIEVPNLALITNFIDIAICVSLLGFVLPSSLPASLEISGTSSSSFTTNGPNNLDIHWPETTKATMSRVTAIAANLSIHDAASLTSAFLPELTYVGGGISFVQNPQLSSLSFPLLLFVGGAVDVTGSKNKLSIIDMPLLLSVGGSFNMSFTPVLTLVNVPMLTLVGDTVQFSSSGSSNSVLTSLDMSQIGLVGGHFVVLFQPLLTSFSLPALTFCGGFLQIDLDTAVTALDFSLFAYTYHDFTVGHTLATTLALPVLTFINGTLMIYENTLILSISIPKLTYAESFVIDFDNDHLTSLIAPLLTYSHFLSISNLANITTISLPMLSHVGRYFQVANNAKLTLLNVQQPAVLATPIICANAPSFVIPLFFQMYSGQCAQGSNACPAFNVSNPCI